jgi:hypothetical protein
MWKDAKLQSAVANIPHVALHICARSQCNALYRSRTKRVWWTLSVYFADPVCQIVHLPTHPKLRPTLPVCLTVSPSTSVCLIHPSIHLWIFMQAFEFNAVHRLYSAYQIKDNIHWLHKFIKYFINTVNKYWYIYQFREIFIEILCLSNVPASIE